MIEDILSDKIKSGSNSVRDNRFFIYLLDSNYNCSMTSFNYTNSLCNDYERVSSFMAFLIRKYGVNFYTSLRSNFSSTDSNVLFDNLIKQSGGIGFADELRKFSTTVSIFRPENNPPGFGFPFLSDQGFNLASIFTPGYLGYRVPSVQPAVLNPFGGLHFYEINNTVGNFKKDIVVPPNTSVSIVIK